VGQFRIRPPKKGRPAENEKRNFRDFHAYG
jgi:hypothetical protein